MPEVDFCPKLLPYIGTMAYQERPFRALRQTGRQVDKHLIMYAGREAVTYVFRQAGRRPIRPTYRQAVRQAGRQTGELTERQTEREGLCGLIVFSDFETYFSPLKSNNIPQSHNTHALFLASKSILYIFSNFLYAL